MIRLSLKQASFGLIALALTACNQVTPMGESKPVISYGDKPAFSLDVAVASITDEYQSPGQAPNVEHSFPITPTQAVHDWVTQRIKGTGKANQLEVVIKNASVIEETLPRTDGIKGFFTNDQTERYSGHVQLELKIYGERKGIPEAEIFVEAKRARTIGENATMQDREKLQFQIVNDLMQEINSQLEKNIPAYFGKYLTM